MCEKGMEVCVREGMGAGKKGNCVNVKVKAAALSAVMGVCACMLAACGDTVQTEEELLVSKTQAEGEGMAPGQPENAAAAGSVAGQVQAPERIQWEMAENSINVTVDAAVVVPDVEGIRTKKVTGRAFTQEDYDRVNQAALGGAKLWDRSNGPTVSELEAKIESLEEAKRNGARGDAPYADKEETLDEQIAMYREYAKTAPEEPVIQEIPAVVDYDAASPEGEGNWLRGQATVDGRNYWVDLDNSLLTGEIRRAVFSVIDSDNTGSWNWLEEDVSRIDGEADTFGAELSDALDGLRLRPETAKEEAGKMLERMGMEEYVPFGGEYCFMTLAVDDAEESSMKQVGYSVYCTREVEGVPVTYTHERGNTPEGALMWWPSEAIRFVYNDEGLASFEWVNPWQVEELSVEPVFLMPFAEVENIFREMILKKSLDDFHEEGDSVEIRIDEVRLGYMKVQEPGEENMEGTLLPVWDFLGCKICRNASGEIKYIIGDHYESQLTINAMDGTIIER